MAFLLNNVVPWGRTLAEYEKMFQLTGEDRQKKIAGFGDGPASFNCEGYENGMDITSYDPIYQFTGEQLAKRISEVRVTVMEQMRENQENYCWEEIRSLDKLEVVRMDAMEKFLKDFEAGKRQGRYRFHELPNRLPVEAKFYSLGLSSHFLFLYTMLGYEFHIQAISEMLRVCREVRIFPLVDLNAKQTELVSRAIEYFKQSYTVEVRKTGYEFQKGANKMLVIH